MSDRNYVTVKAKLGGFTTLLAIAFIVLKLCNVITWSWLWVLSPLWIPIAITILSLLFFLILYIVLYIVLDNDTRRTTNIIRK